MNDVTERIARLAPDKRRLLEIMARQRAPAPDPAAAPSPEREAIQADQFAFETGAPPDLRQVGRFYDAINGQLDATAYSEHTIFLNYGYVPNSNPQYAQARLPDVTLNRNTTRLVLEVIGDTAVRPEHHVMDVGCGRGGTLSVFNRFFSPARLIGVDLSAKAIAFCRRVHRFPHASFVVGNAECLAFGAESFDIVTNIESSHTYNDVAAFYGETWRVLRPGGHFLYTDLMPRDRIDTAIDTLRGLGYVLERKLDITGNVLLSCDETAATHARAFAENNDGEIMDNFLARPGSKLYNEMKNGSTRYMLFKFRKESS